MATTGNCPHGKLGRCRLRFGQGCRWGEKSCRFCHRLDCAPNERPSESFIVPQCGGCRRTGETYLVLEPSDDAAWTPILSALLGASRDAELHVVMRGVEMPAKRLPGRNVGVLSFEMKTLCAQMCDLERTDVAITLRLKWPDGRVHCYPTGLVYTYICDGACDDSDSSGNVPRADENGPCRTAHGLISSTSQKCSETSELHIVLFSHAPTYIAGVRLSSGDEVHRVSTGPSHKPYRWSSTLNPGRISVDMRPHDGELCQGHVGCRCADRKSVV